MDMLGWLAIRKRSSINSTKSVDSWNYSCKVETLLCEPIPKLPGPIEKKNTNPWPKEKKENLEKKEENDKGRRTQMENKKELR